MTDTEARGTHVDGVSEHYSGPSLTERLAGLAAMHAAGELTDADFEEAKRDEMELAHDAIVLARLDSDAPKPIAASPSVSSPPVVVEVPESAAESSSPRRAIAARRRNKWLIATAMICAIALLVGGAVILVNKARADAARSKYLKALTVAGVRDQFANDAAAIANAQRICQGLTTGATTQGYGRDAIGVKAYCPRFYDQFRVIPTPEQQQAAYLGALKNQGLAGKFSSDANAVAHAQKVCADLKAGGAQQGMPQDKVAVQVYCASFLSGYTVLRTITVDGSFSLIDSDPSAYFPSITTYGTSCQGSGGYSDIGPGTTVTVKNGSGTILAQAPLGNGVGTATMCTLPFSVTLTEGQDQYVVEASHRGSLTYSFTRLNVDGLHLTLGS